MKYNDIVYIKVVNSKLGLKNDGCCDDIYHSPLQSHLTTYLCIVIVGLHTTGRVISVEGIGH